MSNKEELYCSVCKGKYLGRPNKLDRCPACRLDYYNQVRDKKRKRNNGVKQSPTTSE